MWALDKVAVVDSCSDSSKKQVLEIWLLVKVSEQDGTIVHCLSGLELFNRKFKLACGYPLFMNNSNGRLEYPLGPSVTNLNCGRAIVHDRLTLEIFKDVAVWVCRLTAILTSIGSSRNCIWYQDCWSSKFIRKGRSPCNSHRAIGLISVISKVLTSLIIYGSWRTNPEMSGWLQVTSIWS